MAGLARLLVEGRDVAPVEVCDTARTRSKGLLGRDGLEGAMLISPAKQVHTFRMRFAIDVAFLDRDGRVLRTRSLPPGRLSPVVLRSRAILEAEAGAFERWGVVDGATVTAEPA
ncbi:DUF192 domain-containing protein [Nitriliruptor alkaliphilus]|uniref:DUF192 domain-containing protein n=1 Tax=Nitriliruptor alkaliphilus TaxID=427918 RepID=UPI000AB4C5EA|nr:DUF192 domain-containing protein [Nitriliruptor alkaliphilus]